MKGTITSTAITDTMLERTDVIVPKILVTWEVTKTSILLVKSPASRKGT